MIQPSPSIELERRQPERNMARFYCLSVERDLFGTVLARRHWGRIGTIGRTLSTDHPSLDAAWTELRALERSKRRRGYVDRTKPVNDLTGPRTAIQS